MRQEIQQIVEGAPSNNQVYLQESETHWIQDIRKSYMLFKNHDMNNKEKTASSNLVGVKWCDIHKEWYVKV